MFSYLIYTHEEYRDILDVSLKRLIKHYPGITPIIATNNKDYITTKYKFIPEENIRVYDSTKTYAEKLKSVLLTLPEKYVLLNHDNNIFVGDVNSQKIKEVVEQMETNNIDQVRLFVSGIENPIFNDNMLHKNNGCYYMSVQCALWNKNTLTEILNRFNNKTYRNIEDSDVQSYVSKLNNYYLSSINDVQFRGEAHYLSLFFPVCHAIVNGRWANSTVDNNKFIEGITGEYGIDLTIRGTVAGGGPMLHR